MLIPFKVCLIVNTLNFKTLESKCIESQFPEHFRNIRISAMVLRPYCMKTRVKYISYSSKYSRHASSIHFKPSIMYIHDKLKFSLIRFLHHTIFLTHKLPKA